jgi:hypothetical protein
MNDVEGDEPKQKRMRLTLTQQLEAIEQFENGESLPSVLSSYGLGKSTFYKILQRKDEIKEKATKLPNKKGLRLRLNETQEILDKRIYDWYLTERRKNIPISGSMLQEAGRKCAEALNYEFAASNGWLESFRTRHNIKANNLGGESAEMDVTVVEDSKEILCPEADAEKLDDAEEGRICPVTLAEAGEALATYLKYVDFNNEELGITGEQYTSLRDQLRHILILCVKASNSRNISK